LGWQTIFDDSFEDSFPDPWQLLGYPTWGRTDCQASDGAFSVWPAANAVAPCLDSYPDNLNAWMIFGPFDLSDAAAAEVTFDRNQSTQQGLDYFKWLVSVDGGYHFYGWRSSGSSSGWVGTTFDLATVPTLGDIRYQSAVWLAFSMSSDGAGTDIGAFVDNVVIRKRTVFAPAEERPAVTLPGTSDLEPAAETRP